MSKGLEALKKVKKFSVLLDSEKDIVKHLDEIIPNMLATIEKELKALEIIKRKRVTVFDIVFCETCEGYNAGVPSSYKLTQKEYDLLKEVLS